MSNEILSCFVFVEITLYIKKGDIVLFIAKPHKIKV